MRVLGEDELDFPCTPPMLHIPLALSCQTHVFVAFGIDKPVQAVLLREAVDKASPVFPNTAREVVCHADVQRAVGSVCHDVHPSAGRLGSFS